MWKKALAQMITKPAELATQLALPFIPKISEPTLKKWSLRVPHSLVQRMQKGNINDPLLKQVLPLPDEELIADGFVADPLAEEKFTVAPGVLHKYYGRVLLLVTNECALNCRFCFRRGKRGESIDWQKALRYLAADATITEVILSGGDPLMLDDEVLAQHIYEIAAIEQMRYLRIHTRLPLIIPQRVTKKLRQTLTCTRLIPIIVVHCNHAQEINDEAQNALLALKNAGITLLNQTVLLRGINDQPERLIELGHALFKAGVLPYYLHLLDKVVGARHFYVTLTQAKKLHAELVKKMPGYLVPKLVVEVVGAAAKQWVL